MNRSHVSIVMLLAATLLGGCLVSDVENYFPDPTGAAGAGGSNDSGTGADAAVDSASTVDGSVEANPDVSADATPTDATATDGSAEASNDATADAPAEAAIDATTDAPKEAAIDSPVDVPPDASVDAPADGPKDAGVDAPTDAPSVSLADCALLLHFDETAMPVGGMVMDNSGLGNNGAVYAGIAPYAAGKFGGAADFDGGYVMIGDNATLRPTTKLTYAAWIYPTAFDPQGSGIIAKRTAYASEEAFTLFTYTGNKLNVDIQTAANRFASNASVALNTWQHVAVVFDGDLQRATIYVNGLADTSTIVAVPEGGISPYTSSLSVGDLPDGGGRFVGRIDEVAIWMRALSADEISALANATGPL